MDMTCILTAAVWFMSIPQMRYSERFLDLKQYLPSPPKKKKKLLYFSIILGLKLMTDPDVLSEIPE